MGRPSSDEHAVEESGYCADGAGEELCAGATEEGGRNRPGLEDLGQAMARGGAMILEPGSSLAADLAQAEREDERAGPREGHQRRLHRLG